MMSQLRFLHLIRQLAQMTQRSRKSYLAQVLQTRDMYLMGVLETRGKEVHADEAQRTLGQITREYGAFDPAWANWIEGENRLF